tara:strand:+ start:898 stop:2223 length:1326 start_codon:yes stop_codon:yes gene_type:complete
MISKDQINKFSNNVNTNHNTVLKNIISYNKLASLSNSNSFNQSHTPIYDVSVTPHLKVTNQKSSGRCWLFAALNVVRREMCKKYKLDNFEFSQSYLFFWDKLERMNYNLECIIKTKDLDVSSRVVQHLLNDPSCDGGQWDMITNLVNKYGLVPKDVYQETYHSSSSRELNMVLKKKFREYSMKLRKSKEPNVLKQKYIEEVYKILCMFLGEPPNNFSWKYLDKDKNYKKMTDLTPLTFYQTHVPFNFNDYACVINDPRKEHPYNHIYTVKYLGNVLDGNKVKYLNLPIGRIKDLVLRSLKNNESVWYGCDVGQFLNRSICRMDKESTQYLKLLGLSFSMNKEERLRHKDSLMTHAMVITGANTSTGNCLEENSCVNDWEVENSWSSCKPSNGYYSMSDKWFDEYVYEVAIKKDLLNDGEKKLLNGEFNKELEPWDPMGSLA